MFDCATASIACIAVALLVTGCAVPTELGITVNKQTGIGVNFKTSPVAKMPPKDPVPEPKP